MEKQGAGSTGKGKGEGDDDDAVFGDDDSPFTANPKGKKDLKDKKDENAGDGACL